MNLSKREKRKLRQQNINPTDIVQEQKPIFQAEPKKSKLKIYLMVFAALIVLAIAYSVYSLTQPGPYDNFAKCLTEKGAVMYGAMDWCKFTQGQKGMFGRSFKYINYKEFQELPGIKKTPTWVINGVWYENTQSFDKLSSITGCKLG